MGSPSMGGNGVLSSLDDLRPAELGRGLGLALADNNTKRIL
jgi:hypothetical protein